MTWHEGTTHNDTRGVETRESRDECPQRPASEERPRTLQRLQKILLNEDVTRALGLLGPGIEGPSLVPSSDEHVTETTE